MKKNHPVMNDVLTNTAGDQEREARSRRFNLVEGLLVMVFVLFILWGVAYPFGVMLDIGGVREASTVLLVIGACYLLFVSPFIHRDTLSSWGLGSPWALWQNLREANPAKRAVLGAVILALFIGLNALNYYNWREVAEFFNFDKTPMRDFDRTFPGILVVFAFGSALSAVIVLFGIRYDNFISAFATAMKIALPLLGLILLGAFAQRGTEAFARFTFRAFFVGAFGYLFWGFVQQLLFSSFFGTRLRKAFAPGMSPDNTTPPGKRAPVAVKFSIGFALIGAPLFWVPLRLSFSAAEVPLVLLPGFAFFLALFGALYGYFYAKDRKRLLVATLSGSCFGLIHINSYGLVAVTFLLGIFLTYVFMKDQNRNLVALGFIHGLLGSSFGMFFSKGQSGALKVDYGVGPWNVDDPAWGVMVVPVLCILAYLWLVRCYLKNAASEERVR
ncbi:MAG: CPBP family intramembrane metalloprotease [Candidatus Hydrogenedens sp.]|nr:CPBP family intramembrane metalloprotease [Candidatus Hydrogenedentota bacterium]NLF56876.1 CPBP family intramembrane metalloprotease [Candidatus Hydrogenedens sp.]